MVVIKKKTPLNRAGLPGWTKNRRTV